jgi:hypothetical protein
MRGHETRGEEEDTVTKRTRSRSGDLTPWLFAGLVAIVWAGVLTGPILAHHSFGKPVQWGVETGSAAALARQGVAPKTFPEGTIFTVTLYPLRDGRTFGAMAGLLIKCGNAMPAGGCTKATGEVLISGDGPA